MGSAAIDRRGSVWRPLRPVLVALAIGLLFGIVALMLSLNPPYSSGGAVHYTHFGGDGFGFDYPDDWPVIAGPRHYGHHGPTVLAAVGIGDFDLGCTETSTSVSCASAPEWTVPDDGIVVAYHFSGHLPMPQPIPSLAAGEEWAEVGGRNAILSRTSTSMRWHFPGAPEFIEARWGPAAAQTAPAQLQTVISSWHFDSPPPHG